MTQSAISRRSPLVASAPVVIVVPADSPIKTLADYIDQARKKPDTVQYGSAGNGTPRPPDGCDV